MGIENPYVFWYDGCSNSKMQRDDQAILRETFGFLYIAPEGLTRFKLHQSLFIFRFIRFPPLRKGFFLDLPGLERAPSINKSGGFS